MGTKVSAIIVGIIAIIMLVILITDPLADAQSGSDDYASGGWTQNNTGMTDDNAMRMNDGRGMQKDMDGKSDQMTQDEMDDMMKRQHDSRMEDSDMNAMMHDKNMDHQDKAKKLRGDSRALGMLNPLEEVKIAICVLQPTESNKAHGIVNFWADGKDVIVMAEVKGLEPNSEHGIHIHEYGDISIPNGTGTGEHYNPEGHQHGMPDNPMRHAGDFGNILADENGNAILMLRVSNITLGDAYNPIIGRGMIIHASDDKGTQPVGDAGARIAQGVIGVGNPKDMGTMPKFSGIGMMNGKPIKTMNKDGYEVEDIKQ